ncbi:MAG: hypothetical protein K2X93_14815 [Candidatus Obscuribacterales bacterium]|nr:hypothetical protein [Candidatus Obscuribacterales bacterium]
MTRVPFLDLLTRHSRDRLEDSLITAFLFEYKQADCALPMGASKFGGSAAMALDLIPKDKNGTRMSLLAQINFSDISNIDPSIRSPEDEIVGDDHSGSPFSNLPASTRSPFRYLPPGILMLFVSPHYQSFKDKDSSWYKLIYRPLAELSPSQIEGGWSEFALMGSCVQFVPAENQKSLLATLGEKELPDVVDWLKQGSNGWSNGLSDGQQLLFSGENVMADWRRAAVVAAFHANGISYDEHRENDPHYKHLVDAAADWIAIWRMSGLTGRIAERRTLYVCIRREDLIKLEFSHGSLVFL